MDPAELFAGIARTEVPMPVVYPASCSPQAWSSASTLLLVRSMLGLAPVADRSTVGVTRADLSEVADLRVDRLVFGGTRFGVAVVGGIAQVTMG